MKLISPSRVIVNFCGFILLELIVSGGVLANSDSNIINIQARRYGYSPKTIQIPAGRSVTLHIKSLDVLHGFYIPDLNMRVDIKPGVISVVELPALKPGKYQFLCDVFCGTGHSGMNGTLHVVDKNGE